jgi:hypothetical protein
MIALDPERTDRAGGGDKPRVTPGPPRHPMDRSLAGRYGCEMSTGKAVVTPTGPSRIHWVALDGIRAFAVVTVMIYHMELRHVLTGGLFGVDVFFLLSGFLITTLLIGEAEKHEGRVHLGFFYARRALRLLPALAAVIAVSVVAVLAISGASRHTDRASVGGALRRQLVARRGPFER